MPLPNREETYYKNYLHIEKVNQSGLYVTIFLLLFIFNTGLIMFLFTFESNIPPKNYPIAMGVEMFLETCSVYGLIGSFVFVIRLNNLVTLVLYDNYMLLYPSKNHSLKDREFIDINYYDVITYEFKHRYQLWIRDSEDKKVQDPSALLIINCFDSDRFKTTYMTRVSDGFELEKKFLELIGEEKSSAYITENKDKGESLPS